jgi:hypothetical protein
VSRNATLARQSGLSKSVVVSVSGSLSLTASIAARATATDLSRDGVVVAGTGLGILVQFAIRGIGMPLAALRANGISSTLRRIGSEEGCRGQDPTAAPEWLSSPLQLGMTGGKDFVTGTAIGAPIVVLIAAFLGALVGVVTHLLDVCVWSPLCRYTTRQLLATGDGSAVRTRSEGSIAPSARHWYADVRLYTAAAAGTANLMITGSAMVSQPAVAAAVLRLAEGPAWAGADGSYAAGALICAVLSFALPMVALHLAWPSPRRATAARDSAIKTPTARVQALTVYESCNRRERVRAAAAFLPGGLRQWRHSYLGDVGYWHAQTTPDTDVSGLETHATSVSSAVNAVDTVPSPPPDAGGGALLRAGFLNSATSAPPVIAVDLPPVPSATVGDPFDLLLPNDLLPPDVLPVVQIEASAQTRQRVLSRTVADACGVAWREALYGEYRGHARLVAQFVVASQALQGLAQAAGELVPRDVPDSAWWSCVASSASQLFMMALCTVVLLWTQPHRTRQNFDAEILPTALQAGICVPVLLLAARRWTPNETIVAGLDAVLDASAMLQPVVGVLFAVYDAASDAELGRVIAAAHTHRWRPATDPAR